MTQGLRLMLWNFTSLVPTSNRLKGSRADSSDIMGQELGASAEFLWQYWMFFAAVQNEMQNGGVPSTVLQWIIGRKPMAVEFHDFFTQCNIVGIFRKLKRISFAEVLRDP